MRVEDQNIALFQDYLDDSLGEIEKLEFENRIQKDEDFRKGFMDFQKLENVIGEVYKTRQARDEIGKLIDFNIPLESGIVKKFRISRFIQMAIAASLVIIWLVWQPNKMSSTEIVHLGFDAVDREVPRLKKQYLSNSKTWYYERNTRSSGYGPYLREYYYVAIQMFEEGDYKQAKEQFVHILTKFESNRNLIQNDSIYDYHKLNTISWIILCDIQTGKNENIAYLYDSYIPWVESLKESTPEEYDFFQYVYSLHLLNQKENREAKNRLDIIIERDGKYSNHAKELRSEIRFIFP